MIIGAGAGSFFTRLKYSHSYKAEEEFYIRLQENAVYPFEDIGYGFFYLRVRSDRIVAGIVIILIAIAFMAMFSWAVDGEMFAIPTGLFILFICFGLITLFGNLAARELIINREAGYLIRIQANGKILAEHNIHNVYIRLQEKYDAVGMKWYYLILGGYQLDDIRLSRMTLNQSAMRGLGRKLAKSIGINYFDYNNTTTRHVVYHYSSFSLKGDGFELHDGDSGEEEEEYDYTAELEDNEEDKDINDAEIVAEFARDEYEKYVDKQLLTRHFEETEDAALDEMYYNAVIKSGETIKENVSREDKIEYLRARRK